MPDEAKQRHSRARLWIWAAVGVVLLGSAIGLGWYLRSPHFADFVRRRLIVSLEDATGGRVELTSFHWNLSQLAFEADGLTIHGLEPQDQLPYAHVDRVLVGLHIVSFIERRINLQRLELQHPVIHLIVYPDGRTNAPEPKVKPQSTESPVQQLFDLAVGHADLRDGMLLLNERRVPLDFGASDILASMTYNHVAQRYDGSAQVGKMDAKYQDFRDVAAQAELQFSLWRNVAEIKELKLTSQQSSLQASGKLTQFDHPQLQLTYSSTLNVAQLGAVSRTPQLQAGTLILDGSGKYSEAAGFASQGRIAFRDLDYLDNGVALRKANLNSNFSLIENHLTLTRIAARLLGGTVTGDADIKNLVPLTPAPTAPVPVEKVATAANKRTTRGPTRSAGATPVSVNAPETQEGSAHLRLSGMSLTEVSRTLSTRSLPLNKLNPVGSANGAVNLTWKESLTNAVADLALEVAAPPQPADNQLPVNASLRGRYNARSGAIDLSALDLRTPHTHLNATGRMGSTTAALTLGLNTTSLTEFQPLLAAMGNAPPPVELGGELNFNGTLNGRLRAPQIAGHLEATNFTYVYTPVATPPAPQKAQPARKSWLHLTSSPPAPVPPKPVAQTKRIHIDEFVADFQYSPSGAALHHAVIREGSSQLNLDGTTTLDKGTFTAASQFQVQAAMHNADVSELQRAVGVDYPISGKLNFTLQAAGSESNTHGQGQISLVDGQAHGRPIKSLTSKIVFANRTVQFEDIHLQAARGKIAGSAGYDFATNAVKFDLTGESIDLEDIPEVQTPHLQIEGIVDFTAKGSGTLDEPIVNAHLEVVKLVLNGEKIGTIVADAVTHGRQLQLTARSNFPHASFSLDGAVQLQGDLAAKLNLQFTGLDINPFLPADLRPHVTRQASLNGEAQLSGPLKQPRLLNGSLNIREFSVEVQHVALKSDGPVELTFANETVSVQHCSLVSEDTHFTLTGTASFQDERRLDLRANGSLSLKLAQTLNPDVTSYGESNINLTIGGTVANPLISGRVEIVHGGLSMIDLPAGLGDINGTLVFNRDRLEVEKLTGRMGGGQVTFGGFVTYGRTLGFQLTSSGRDIRFRYAGISVTSDQELHLTGTLQNSTLSGNITVTRFAQIPSTDLQNLLAQAGAPARIPNPKSPLNNLHLDVRILSTPELTVETSLAKLSGDVDLRLRGTAERPVLLGRINIAEGDIKLAGTKYHLDRGDITFLDPVRIDPVLDVEATTRVRDYDITIGLHGTLERLNTTYRSDPPLSSDDIISLLAFGRTQSESAAAGASSPGFGANASGAILSEALNQTVTNRFSKLFGVSSIRINPSVGGPDNDPNARLTLEQQVSNNITLTYITNLARSAQQVIQFEYNINSEYTVQGIRDENGVVSFDLLIRKRKR